MTRNTWPRAAALTIPCAFTGIGYAYSEELATHVPDSAEAAIAADMPAPRRRDFLLGRLAAARAVARLGCGSRPITRRGSAPDFGADLRGSISHSHGLALAIAVPTEQAAGVGVDIELGRLSPRAAHRITTPRERTWIEQARSHAQASLRATVLFAVKESVFKALSHSTDSSLRLTSITVDSSGQNGPFKAHARCDSNAGAPSTTLDVGWGVSEDAVLAWALHRPLYLGGERRRAPRLDSAPPT